MSALRSITEVAEVIAAAARPDRRIVVGIVGPPGAGKSTIADAVVEHLNLTTSQAGRTGVTGAPHSAALLPMDGFHLPQRRLVALGRRERMGAPDTFDVDGFLTTLRALRAPTAFGNSGVAVLAPGFDRTVEEAVPGAITIDPECPIVVVEGNYLLLDSNGWGATLPLLELSLFVTLDRDIRLNRLIERHRRFGKTPEQARAWALGPDEANAQLIDATRSRASHLIAL